MEWVTQSLVKTKARNNLAHPKIAFYLFTVFVDLNNSPETISDLAITRLTWNACAKNEVPAHAIQ